MPAKFKNNASATIAASISDVDTTIVLTTGFGSYFPTLTAGFYFFATLFNASGESEIVKVTARAIDTLTVVRAQDGTTAKAFNAGDGLALRIVSANLENFLQLDGDQTIAGVKTFSSSVIANAGLVGNVTGNVTGNVSGNAGTVTNGVYTTGNQTIAGTKTFSADVNIIGSVYRTPDAGSGYLTYGNNGATNSGLYYDQTNNEISIWTTSSKRFSVDSSGNANSTGNFTAAGDVTAYSDERLKSDIQTITNALELVKQLRGTAYIKDGKASLGVVAQEVQKVIPQVVHEGSDGYLSVAYGNIVGVLIEAVKELNAKVEEMKGA